MYILIYICDIQVYYGIIDGIIMISTMVLLYGINYYYMVDLLWYNYDIYYGIIWYIYYGIFMISTIFTIYIYCIYIYYGIMVYYDNGIL